jgi:hydantoinase/oxoprolinase-like protein
VRKASVRVMPVECAPVFFHDKAVIAPVFKRVDLVASRSMKGPAVITEYSATTVIPAGKKFWVDSSENLIIKTGVITAGDVAKEEKLEPQGRQRTTGKGPQEKP